MRRDQQDQTARVGRGGLCLPLQFEIRATLPSPGYPPRLAASTLGETADHHRGLSVLNGNVGRELVAVEDGNVVTAPPVSASIFRSMCILISPDFCTVGVAFRVKTKILVLDLRNCDGTCPRRRSADLRR